MSEPDDFDAVRRDPDPVRQGRRASELIVRYQQRATELARLRRVAIERARDQGMTYTDIATAFGLSKGRITQIRSGAPAAERAFFGVGPVAIGVPLRSGMDDRARTYIDAADVATQEQAEALLTTHALACTRFTIRPDRATEPTGDAIVVCGPKSAPIGANLLAEDPALSMINDGTRWWIEDRRADDRFGSPRGDDPPGDGDIAYVARHRHEDRIIVHIAGIHSYGSLGAVHYLAGHLAEVWATAGDTSFSLAVRCIFEDLTITSSELLAGPYIW